MTDAERLNNLRREYSNERAENTMLRDALSTALDAIRETGETKLDRALRKQLDDAMSAGVAALRKGVFPALHQED